MATVTPFWAFILGFLAEIVAIVIWAIVWYQRSEKAKRSIFERESAAIQARAQANSNRMATHRMVLQDVEALRALRSRVATTEGPMTDADTFSPKLP